MATYIKKLHYVVTIGFTVDLPGPDEKFLEIIGTYESLEDAKRAVNANAGLISDNDRQFLTIHRVNLEECKLHDFYRKDLKSAVAAALQKQRAQEAEDYVKSLQAEAAKGDSEKEGTEHIFRGPQDNVLPRLPRGSIRGEPSESQVYVPVLGKEKPMKNR